MAKCNIIERKKDLKEDLFKVFQLRRNAERELSYITRKNKYSYEY